MGTPSLGKVVEGVFLWVCVSVGVKKDCLLFGFAPSGFGTPFGSVPGSSCPRLLVLGAVLVAFLVCRRLGFLMSFLSFFFVRVLLSLWVLLPGPRFGWSCGSVRAVWSGGPLSLWGGSAPASACSVSAALWLFRA